MFFLSANLMFLNMPVSEYMAKPSKKLLFQSLKGMHDILPADQPLWDKLRQSIKDVAEYYNFLRIDTPILENAELFEHPLGETSDVVEK